MWLKDEKFDIYLKLRSTQVLQSLDNVLEYFEEEGAFSFSKSKKSIQTNRVSKWTAGVRGWIHCEKSLKMKLLTSVTISTRSSQTKSHTRHLHTSIPSPGRVCVLSFQNRITWLMSSIHGDCAFNVFVLFTFVIQFQQQSFAMSWNFVPEQSAAAPNAEFMTER